MNLEKKSISEQESQTLYLKYALEFSPVFLFSFIVIVSSLIKGAFGLFEIIFIGIVFILYLTLVVRKIITVKDCPKYFGETLLIDKKHTSRANSFNDFYFIVFESDGLELYIQVPKKVYNGVRVGDKYYVEFIKTKKKQIILFEIYSASLPKDSYSLPHIFFS